MRHTEAKRSLFCLVKSLEAAPALPQQILESKILVTVRLPLISMGTMFQLKALVVEIPS